MANNGNSFENPGIGLREWCRANRVAPSTLSKALAVGKVARLADGSLDVLSADEWLANRGSNPPSRRGAGLPRQGSVAAQQARLIGARASLARLEFRRRRGELLPAAEVRKAAFSAARRVRDRLLAITPRIKHELAAMSDHVEVERRLEAELKAVCQDLANPETYRETP